MRLLIDTLCLSCNYKRRDVIVVDKKYPPCTQCGGPTERLWEASTAPAVIGDDIPGGVLINNALCHSDGTPRKFYTKSEIARVAKEKGYTNYVQHVGTKGGDRNPHTTRWI